MKVPGLEGDYCPACASVLASVKEHPKNVVVMCGSVCHSTLQQSGDYERLNAPAPVNAPVAEAPAEDAKTTDRRSEERDPGEVEQHKAEKTGYVTEPK